MKKSVENQMKEAVESWEDKSSDLGFDKGLVWSSIASQTPREDHRIPWFKIAVAIILLFLSWGWGNSYFSNKQLKQEKIVMLGNMQTLGDEVKMFHEENAALKPKITHRVDTVIRLITVEKESTMPNDEYQRLMMQFNKLQKQYIELENELMASNRQYGILEDSMSAMAINLQLYKNQQQYDLAVANKAIGLRVDEEAMAALSQQNKERINAESKPKNKFKLVLFNKSKSSVSKAPVSRGIRL